MENQKQQKGQQHYSPDHISKVRVLTDDQRNEFLEKCRIAEEIDYAYDELVLAHIKARNITFAKIAEKSGLNEQYFRKLRKPGSTWKSCVVSIAYGLELSLFDTITLLASAGFCFESTSKLDRAYMLLIEAYPGLDIGEANALLSELGFKGKQLLGSQMKGPYMTKRRKEAEKAENGGK